jgi:hypothetical protein
MTDNNPGCFTPFLRLFGLDKKRVEKQEVMPYLVRDDFLSKAEASFFHVLKAMCGDDLVICPKVSLRDLFYVSRPDINIPYLNKINQKHVDFLLCNPKTLRPIMAIELDDSSHSRLDRIERDAFVEQVFVVAHLPLVRIPVQHAYDIKELEATLRNALKGGQQPDVTQKQQGDTTPAYNEAPVCPKCGSRMVIRTAQRGNYAGQQFYGCPNYPMCRETILLDSQTQS